MIPTKIFLDLDDVLNKFTMWALRHVGCPINDDLDYSQYERAWGYDIVKAANALYSLYPCGGGTPFTKDSFWSCFDEEAWASVPPSDEFIAILCASRATVGTKNVYVLTRPIPYPGCLEGKRQWIKRYIPVLEDNLIIGKDKFLCAKPEHLLIDDLEGNVNAWQEAGGRGILFPRPWNSKWGVSPGRYIADLFAGIGAEMQERRDRARGRRK